MRQRNDWLNAVFQAFVEQIIIKLQASLVGLQLIALRENTRPGNRGAKTFEAHLGKQRQVLWITMIKIDRLMVRVVFPATTPSVISRGTPWAPAVITSATLIPLPPSCQPPSN